MCAPWVDAIAKTDAIFVVDAITGLGTMKLDIEGWGLDVVIGGSQKAFMIPPGLAFMSVSPKAWSFADSATLPHFYFNLKKEKKSGDAGESSWTPSTALILALAEALKYVKQIGMAQADRKRRNAGQGHARRCRKAGPGIILTAFAGVFGNRHKSASRASTRASSSKNFAAASAP